MIKLYRVNLPKSTVSFIDYLKLLLYLLYVKLTGNQGVILNLPLEIQYPYLFYKRWNGEEFIGFAEKLRKRLMLDLYWSNSWSQQLNRFELRSFPVSWDYVPTYINLAIDLNSLRQTVNRRTDIKKIFDKVVALKKQQIKAIINKQGKIIASLKLPLSLSPIQQFLVFS